ncbi:hypothetical protein T06_9849 [Trichinella sp. T6]|nr:hypothetical protein T06_9849 [Trichinella sp. T6]
MADMTLGWSRTLYRCIKWPVELAERPWTFRLQLRKLSDGYDWKTLESDGPGGTNDVIDRLQLNIFASATVRAVMDTVHLVGQGGGWGGEREKAGIKICDMEYEKVSFYMDLEGTLEMAVLIILLKKGKIVLLITSAILFIFLIKDFNKFNEE